MALADDGGDRRAAIGGRLLANTALHLMAVGGMPEREAWAAAEKAMDSPDPFPLPTFEELDGSAPGPGPSAWPPPGWDPRVLEAVRWAMVQELEDVIARCEAVIVARRDAVPEDGDGP